MKTRYTTKALLIYILPGIILSGCTVPGNSHSPSKGEIIISDELKEDNTSSDTTPEPKDINIVKLPEENGSIKENTNFAEIYSDGETKEFPSGIVTSGNAAFEQYTYIDSIAGKYAGITSQIADKLKGRADVYNMVIPTSIGITFPDNQKNTSGSSDQKKSLAKIAGKMSGNVKSVPLYNEMMNHRKEYIYFRTDHH